MISYKIKKLKNVSWMQQSKVLTQLSPPCLNISCSKNEMKLFLRNNNALLARWWTNFDTTKNKNWWHIVKDHPQRIEEYSSNTRSKIRRGLKKFYIERIKKSEVGFSEYEIYKQVNKQYNNRANTESPETFFKFFSNLDPATHEIWAIRAIDSGHIVGLSDCFVDNNTCFINSIWILKDANKGYASYAFFYLITDHYLETKNFKYVSDGCRSLSHDTSIHDFLIEKFNFKKIFVDLKVAYRFNLGLIINAISFLLPIFKIIPLNIFHKLSVLIILQKYNTIDE